METQEWLMLIGGIVLLMVSIAAVIFSVKSGKHLNKALSAGLAEVKEIRARVKELTKENDGDEKFFVIFETEENEEIKISVENDVFGDFQKDESGILTFADGEFLNFVVDEEI